MGLPWLDLIMPLCPCMPLTRPLHAPACPSAQLPSAAANPKGPYLPKELTEHRPSLHTEFQKLALETALDAALLEVRSKKAAAASAQASPPA